MGCAAARDAHFGDPRRASHVAERCREGPAQASVPEHHRAAAAWRRAPFRAAPREGAVRAHAACPVALERHAVGGCSVTDPPPAEQPCSPHRRCAHALPEVLACGKGAMCVRNAVAPYDLLGSELCMCEACVRRDGACHV
jgi:hypothetical protein